MTKISFFFYHHYKNGNKKYKIACGQNQKDNKR